ncbi:MAG: KH domain-containing protein [Candidatus Moranbacteria bacterium]|nr:KH domain-containing protein [Candidatus Moranbacteria bacterium]
MEREERNKELKEIVEGLLSRMGFASEVEIEESEEEGKETVICDIRSEESSFLIGQYGVNLQSLQHIARVMVRKRFDENVNFILDVNSYRKEKNESIVKLAKNLADEAVSEKRAVVMRPMTPYERRVVHLEMSKDERIQTESIGEGDDRRIVIKPVELV